MAMRPPPPPVKFSWDGLYASALPEETLLQALARKRLPILSRSMRYHRARGPLCGIGQCTGCLVRVNGVPNVRACRTVPKEGDVVRGENAWPSVRWDVLSIFDLLFPGHIDTMHGFRSPVFLRPSYQRVVRRLAGTGRLPDPGSENPDSEPAPEVWETDLLVVGAGPVGVRVAVRASSGPISRRVLLIDRSRPPADPATLPPSVTYRPDCSLVFLPARASEEGPFAGIVQREREGGVAQVRASQVVLATGGYDASLLFGGNDRPGVVTGDGALALAPPNGRPPFSHALLFGGGARAKELLPRLGDRCAALAAPGEIDGELRREAEARGVQVLPGQLLVASRGRRRVRGAVLQDRKNGARTVVRADAIVLAHRRVPNVPLLFQAGAKMHWRTGTGAYYPDLDAGGSTSVPGLFAIGAVAGYPGAAAGASADRCAAGLSGPSPAAVPAPTEGRVALDGPDVLAQYLWELLQVRPQGKRVLCPCEDVVAPEVDEAVHEGFTGTEVVKRYTGVGTGVCQGRYCLPETILLLSLLEKKKPAEVGFITQRPPVWPTRLRDLARLPPEPEAVPATGRAAP